MRTRGGRGGEGGYREKGESQKGEGGGGRRGGGGGRDWGATRSVYDEEESGFDNGHDYMTGR